MIIPKNELNIFSSSFTGYFLASTASRICCPDLTLPTPWPFLAVRRSPTPSLPTVGLTGSIVETLFRHSGEQKQVEGRKCLEKIHLHHFKIILICRWVYLCNIFLIVTVTMGWKSYISHFIGYKQKLTTQPTSLKWLWSLFWIWMTKEHAKMHRNTFWNVYERYLWKMLRFLCLKNAHIIKCLKTLMRTEFPLSK